MLIVKTRRTWSSWPVYPQILQDILSRAHNLIYFVILNNRPILLQFGQNMTAMFFGLQFSPKRFLNK